MKNIFDLVIRFMAISAMLLGGVLAFVATAPKAVAQEPTICGAVASSNFKRFKRLLAKGDIDLNTRCRYNYGEYTLLGVASVRHDIKVFNSLILAGADPTVKSEYRERALGRSGMVSNIWLWSRSSHADALQAIKFLIANGAPPIPNMNLTQIIDAPSAGDPSQATAEIIDALVKAGVSVDNTDSLGWTPLMHVAGHPGKIHLLKHLISLGANVNVQSPIERHNSGFGARKWPKGWTPLMRAVVAFDYEGVEILLAAGADPHIVSAEDKTAYDYAYSAEAYRGYTRHEEYRKFLEWYEGVEAEWKPGQRISKAPIAKTEERKTSPSVSDEVASPKKSESKVPSYGTAGDCSDFIKGQTPKVKGIMLKVLERNKVSCYTVPDQCPNLLAGEDREVREAMKKALGTLRIFCYQ